MGRNLLLWTSLLLAGAAQGAVVEHQRGEYRFGTGPVPDFVERAELPAQWPADAPGADDERWRYWLYDLQSDRRGGRDALFVDYAYEARGASLVGEAGRFQVSFNPEYQHLQIHDVELRRDGVWHDRLDADRISLARREDGFEQDLADGIVTALIVLDDVRRNDVIRVAYSVTGSNPVLAGQGNDWMRFGWQNPTLRSRLRVLMDPGAKPRVHRENGAPEPVVRERPDGFEVVLDAPPQPVIVDDQQYPAWYQPYPLAQVARDQGWKQVVDWALPLYPRVDRLPDELEAKVQEWRALRDERARITAAVRLVQDEVRYFGVEMGENTHRPTAPAETWRRRYGDCKDKVYLLVSLLGRMDIRAVPALVSTTRGKAVSGFVPSASVFNHVIARIESGREVLWVDPTITLQGGTAGVYDLSAYGAALAIAPGGSRIEPIEAPDRGRDRNGITVVERYVPQADAREVRLDVETVYRGDSADQRRRSFANERGDDLSRRYADYYRRRLGELEVLAAPQLRDDREDNALTVTERYLLKAPFDDEGVSVKALGVFADTLQEISRLPTSMARTAPLAYAAPGRYRHEIEVAMPERWTATFGKEQQRVSSKAFEYARDVDVADGNARVVYQLDVRQSEVAGGDAAGHLEQVRRLQDGLSATLRFRMPAGVAADERQRRLQQLLRNAIDEGTDK